MILTPYGSYRLYRELKVHFIGGSYNYLEKRLLNNTEEVFNTRCKNKGIFKLLSEMYPDGKTFVMFLIANFVHDPDANSYELTRMDAKEVFLQWKNRVRNLRYKINKDIKYILDSYDIDKVLDSSNQKPILLTMLYREYITPESFALLLDIYKFSDQWNENLQDKLFWPKTEKKMLGYIKLLKKLKKTDWMELEKQHNKITKQEENNTNKLKYNREKQRKKLYY